jgi:hypothetical protein
MKTLKGLWAHGYVTFNNLPAENIIKTGVSEVGLRL